MSISFFTSIFSQLFLTSWRRPLLLYAGIWTAVLTVTVAVAALTPEMAFIWSISQSSSFSTACGSNGGSLFVRVPADLPSEIMCLPANLFRRSKIDLLVPPIFAGLIVASSACVIRSLGL